MYWDATRPPAQEPEFVTETGRLRPGVPIVHARGTLDRTTVGELRRAVGLCLATSPWAVVVDLTALSELQPGALPGLVDVARRARCGHVGLHLVTAGGAADDVLGAVPPCDRFTVHRSVPAAEQALGGRS